jgi:hypothetical protein
VHLNIIIPRRFGMRSAPCPEPKSLRPVHNSLDLIRVDDRLLQFEPWTTFRPKFINGGKNPHSNFKFLEFLIAKLDLKSD